VHWRSLRKQKRLRVDVIVFSLTPFYRGASQAKRCNVELCTGLTLASIVK